ncbi:MULTISPECIES: hypothetical protein [unclassified Leptolyngbya]|uniref:hypothetical protein n=1 Tax=unclassified Leptolyngbya TaxID=2650499 RepID=UPI001684D3C2|nr:MULTISPECIES: hypothetical protein [unclassified Leptolyngbya]MBD1909051.1 hypothetical protein [Leptolyngbya sp. FACHB-8]MBD2157432.1 hypothetical protein [Leptolyngbya sp. FACHB-16]
MLVSTFELLVKPITPPDAGPAALARKVVQGYFLTIANTSNVPASLRLTFAATTPELNIGSTIVIRDITGGNEFGDLVPTGDPKRLNYNITIPANDTALVILQPDVTRPEVRDGELEVRGYVEINANPSFIRTTYELLVTPEHRGTFFSGSATAPATDIDQLVYSLPTATGKSQYSLTPALIPFPLPIPPKSIVKDVTDGSVVVPPPSKVPEVPPNPNPLDNIQAMLLMMAQRIEGLESLVTQGQAFIQPSERPAVGMPARNGN